MDKRSLIIPFLMLLMYSSVATAGPLIPFLALWLAVSLATAEVIAYAIVMVVSTALTAT